MKRIPKRWGLSVALLYGLALLALTWPVLVASFFPETSLAEAGRVFGMAGYWGFIVVMVGCQLALLSLPVGSLARPTTRRTILAPVLASGLCFAALLAGAVASGIELFARDGALELGPVVGAVALASWAAWAFVFFRWSRGRSAENFLFRQSRLLFKGSVLELLIAVPTHIVARSREYCCAGLMSFIGIAAGIAVMLFSFGPSVYFLYLDRWRKLHRDQD